MNDETTALGIRADKGRASSCVCFTCGGGRGGDLVSAFFAILFSAGLVIVVVRALFPAGRLFPVAFASLVAVYAAIFSLFVEEIFRGVDAAFLVIGFSLPILFFLVGCWLQRNQVKAVVAHPTIRSEQRVMRAVIWLVPVFLVGAAALLLSSSVKTPAQLDILFLGAMFIIGLNCPHRQSGRRRFLS